MFIHLLSNRFRGIVNVWDIFLLEEHIQISGPQLWLRAIGMSGQSLGASAMSLWKLAIPSGKLAI